MQNGAWPIMLGKNIWTKKEMILDPSGATSEFTKQS